MKPQRPIYLLSLPVAVAGLLISAFFLFSGSAPASAVPSGATSNKDIIVASLRKGTTNDFAIARVRGNRVVGYAGTMNSSEMGCFSGRVKSNRFLSDKGEAVVAGIGGGSSLLLDRIRQQVKPNKHKWVKLQPSSIQELARLSEDTKRHMYSVIDTCAAGGVLGY